MTTTANLAMTSATTHRAAHPPPTTRSRPLRSTALREVATYLGLVTAMVVGIALALPHAGIVPSCRCPPR